MKRAAEIRMLPSVGAFLLVFVVASGASLWADKGGVVQRAGTEGCISSTGTGGSCTVGVALDGATALAPSSDGTSIYGVSASSSSVTVLDRDTVTGVLAQKALQEGCVSDDGTGGLCATGTALVQPRGVVVSPDGKNVYVGAELSDAVVIFDRDPNGEIDQLVGQSGCISETGTSLACVDGVALEGAYGLDVSPDGANVYVAAGGSSAIAVFDRDSGTGELTQKAGTDACVSDDGTGGDCVDGTGLGFVTAVAVSPDGANVYAASFGASAVVIFDRDPSTGALTQKAGTAGCVSEDGTSGACADGKVLDGAFSVVVSPDGEQVYVASWFSGGVAVFDRDTGTGALAQKADPDGCINNGGGLGCATGHHMLNPFDLILSPDGENAYLAAWTSGAIVVLDRDPSSGALTQRSGPTGCLSDDGSGGGCVDGVALNNAAGVIVSPDDASVYAAAFTSDGIVVLDRSIFTDGFEGGDTTAWSSSVP